MPTGPNFPCKQQIANNQILYVPLNATFVAFVLLSALGWPIWSSTRLICCNSTDHFDCCGTPISSGHIPCLVKHARQEEVVQQKAQRFKILSLSKQTVTFKKLCHFTLQPSKQHLLKIYVLYNNVKQPLQPMLNAGWRVCKLWVKARTRPKSRGYSVKPLSRGWTNCRDSPPSPQKRGIPPTHLRTAQHSTAPMQEHLVSCHSCLVSVRRSGRFRMGIKGSPRQRPGHTGLMGIVEADCSPVQTATGGEEYIPKKQKRACPEAFSFWRDPESTSFSLMQKRVNVSFFSKKK